MTSARDVWRETMRVYNLNKRDYVYAYGGAVSFVHLNELYSNADKVRCSCVAIVSTRTREREALTRCADSLLHRHGVVIVSLTWFRLDETSDRTVRDLELERMERAAAQYEDDDDDDENKEQRVDSDEDNCRAERGTAIDQILSGHIGSKTKNDDYNEDGGSGNGGGGGGGCDGYGYEDKEDEDDEEERKAKYGGEEDFVVDTDAFRARAGLELTLLRAFFGKLLAYTKQFDVANFIGMPFHRTYRLIDRRRIANLCKVIPFDEIADKGSR